MKYVVDNAIIMAAGFSSRLIPIAYEKPKALIKVNGEVLIERQIRQLKEAGIHNIIIVTGYKKEAFDYLVDKFNVRLIENEEYKERNNHSSLYAVKDYLRNSYICSSDLYFTDNPFTNICSGPFYATVFLEDKNREWCIKTNEKDFIERFVIGRKNNWVLRGHAFFTKRVSRRMLVVLEREYYKYKTLDKPWEQLYLENTNFLQMRSKQFPTSTIYKIDTLEQLKQVDPSYCNDLDCKVMEELCMKLNCEVKEVLKMQAVKDQSRDICGMKFIFERHRYFYNFNCKSLHRMK
ncbi:MAG: NTP transferase domain-containing protein [Erysipelotrichaceae bacterium]